MLRGGIVYIGTEAGIIYALELATGKFLWKSSSDAAVQSVFLYQNVVYGPLLPFAPWLPCPLVATGPVGVKLGCRSAVCVPVPGRCRAPFPPFPLSAFPPFRLSAFPPFRLAVRPFSTTVATCCIIMVWFQIIGVSFHTNIVQYCK